MKIEIIVAVDRHGGFGKDGKIPWYYPKDLKHFKELTSGHICIMGRKTYEDMLKMRLKRDKKAGKEGAEINLILPGRQCFVVTSKKKLETPGAIKAKSIQDAIHSIRDNDNRKVFIIGGERMYREGLDMADTLHITWVPGEYDCDKFFPIDAFVGNSPFKLISQEEDGELLFTTYGRRDNDGGPDS